MPRQSPALWYGPRRKLLWRIPPWGAVTIVGRVFDHRLGSSAVSLSLSLVLFFRPILYFHFCQILLSRTAAPLRDVVRTAQCKLLYFRRCIGGLLMRRALICVLAHRHALAPLVFLLLFFTKALRGAFSRVIALPRAPVWYPFRAHTPVVSLRYDARSCSLVSFLCDAVSLRRTHGNTPASLYLLNKHAVQKGTN